MSDKNFSTYFRPHTFGEVVGQEVVKQALIKIAKADGIACRAIFLRGAYGCGKTTLARIFAAAMNDPDFSKVGDVTPENCNEVYAKNSQLYMEFDASVAGNVEAIRALAERLSTVPDGRRVVVFDEVHACSKAALNALLKIVEDGVPNTIFVFASTEDILPTIKSRSLCLELTTIPHMQMKERLKQVCAELELVVGEEQLDAICMKSGGHMRDALSILQLYSIVGDEGLKTSYQTVIKFFAACCKKEREQAKAALNELLLYNIVDVKNSLGLFIKNCFISKEGDKLYAFQKANITSKIFGYFYSPVLQQALKDEMGVELAFRSFIEKICV